MVLLIATVEYPPPCWMIMRSAWVLLIHLHSGQAGHELREVGWQDEAALLGNPGG